MDSRHLAVAEVVVVVVDSETGGAADPGPEEGTREIVLHDVAEADPRDEREDPDDTENHLECEKTEQKKDRPKCYREKIFRHKNEKENQKKFE